VQFSKPGTKKPPKAEHLHSTPSLLTAQRPLSKHQQQAVTTIKLPCQDSNTCMSLPPAKRTHNIGMLGPGPPLPELSDFGLLVPSSTKPELSDFGLLSSPSPVPELSDFGLISPPPPKPGLSNFGLLSSPSPAPVLSDFGLLAQSFAEPEPKKESESSKHTVTFMWSENEFLNVLFSQSFDIIWAHRCLLRQSLKLLVIHLKRVVSFT